MSNEDKKTLTDQIFDLMREYDEMEEVIDEEANLEVDPPKLPELLRIRKKLSTLSAKYARTTAKHLREYRNKKAQKETQEYLAQRKYMDEKDMAATPAKAKAKQDVSHFLIDEATSKGLYDSGNLILKQVNEVLASIKQDISVIKKEYENLTSENN